MYGKCLGVQYERLVFDKMAMTDLLSWNAMISRYAQSGYGEPALNLFRQMQLADMKPNQFTLVSMLRVSCIIESVDLGKQVHAHVIKAEPEADVFTESALVDMYANYGYLKEACNVFDKMPKWDLVSCNAMIAGYARNQHLHKAVNLFRWMQHTGMKPSQFTLTSILNVSAFEGALEPGKQIHSYVIKIGFDSDVCVGSGLVDVYGKCGDMGGVHGVFDKMPKHDEVSWTAMISGHVQCECNEEALKLYYQMQLSSIKPDNFIFAILLKACASLAVLESGKQIHANIIRGGFILDLVVGTALIDMYAKCGSIVDACKIFDEMPARNVVSWNAIITGCAQHGHAKKALTLFDQMQHAGMEPDHVTLVGALSACSHAGLIDTGRDYFNSMSQDFGITPRMEHYACMVDILGRAGCLDEAESFISKMPFEPSVLVWRTLLGACRVHGNMKLGKLAAKRLSELEPQDDAMYVLLSNIYAAADQWDDVANARKIMKDRGVKKEPGYSWIEIKNRIYMFVVEDRSHS